MFASIVKSLSRTFLAILMTIVQLLLGHAGLVAPKQPAAPRDLAPVVFVHGLAGWGEGVPIDKYLPQWGMNAGSMKDYLAGEGYECYAASLGPVSSAWDRACELYAHITGTRVDYGAAHSAAHNHERCGEDYGEPLVPGWGEPGRELHLIGHSFGGATARLFAQLCEEGSAAEREATPKAELSPLFSGKLKGRVASITTLGAPHNGSSSMEPGIDGTRTLILLLNAMGIAGGVVPFVGDAYPYHLTHFHLTFRDFLRTPWNMLRDYSNFNDGKDNAEWDLSIDGAAAVNKGLSCLPGVYYFSYAAQVTEDDGRGSQVPGDDIWFLFHTPATAMGQKRAPFTTAGGTLVDETWAPNDGLVNVVSARAPAGEPYQTYNPKKLEAGVWQVMPLIIGWDHYDFVGGMKQVDGTPGIREFYLGLMRLLEQVPQ